MALVDFQPTSIDEMTSKHKFDGGVTNLSVEGRALPAFQLDGGVPTLSVGGRALSAVQLG